MHLSVTVCICMHRLKRDHNLTEKKDKKKPNDVGCKVTRTVVDMHQGLDVLLHQQDTVRSNHALDPGIS